MPRAAVLGSPVGHSRSPVLHTAAYRALGLTGWTYEAIECPEDALAGLLDGLGPEWAGLSLTMPLKRRGLELADEASGLARAVGAANTLLLSVDEAGRPLRTADNTDVGGMVDALRRIGVERAGRAVVLGAGGTAAAALAALDTLGVGEVVVAARSVARTGDLLAAADRIGLQPHVLAWTSAEGDGVLREAIRVAELVVSTVPAGAADALADVGFRPDQVLLDVVYDPWPTPLATAAVHGGAAVVAGADLLVHQAARQVRLMTGHAVDPAVLYAALAGPA